LAAKSNKEFMMDYLALLKRAFQITIKYRALWIFGFFLALCSATGGGGGSGGGSSGSSGGNGSYNGDHTDLIPPLESVPTPDMNIWLLVGGIVAGLCCLILLVIVIGAIVRAVTRTALIGMVDQIEETEAVTMKDGWRIGWSKRAWRVFLIGLIIGVPLVIIFGLLLFLAFSPILLVFLENTALLVLGIVATIALMLLWILAVIVVTIVVSPWQELAWRYTVIRQTGALESLIASYAVIRQNLKDVALVTLLLIGIAMVWAVVSIVLGLFVVLLALLAGILPALIAFLFTWTWWVALLVGFLVFMVVVSVPMTFVTGLYLIFRSAIWTLTFRELNLASPASPQPALTGRSLDEGQISTSP
jgi:hypothetical protein